MRWEFWLLAAAGCYAAGVSFYVHTKADRLKFLGLFWASLFLILVNVAALLDTVFSGGTITFILGQTMEWGHVLCIAFVLSTLLLFVRESKPEFSRFPIIYVIFPLFIILSYFFVYNTIILKHWLLNIYQAGAVLVAVLMYGIYNYRESIYLTCFAGSILFLITFILYLSLPQELNIVWVIGLAISIITLFSGYWIIEEHYEKELENG